MSRVENIAARLLSWYDAHARALPWRGEKDPYRIWLSEIMLQQTGAKTVEGYYARFLRRFPTVFDLACAREDEVLKLWEGLGYYARARNLHAAARRVAEDGGTFPQDAAGLSKLPGIGPYTARAVASIAYGEAAPALDGNQMRVLSRVHAVEAVLNTPFDLEELALRDISRERPGDYNQALMDLGATVCTPANPRCEDCPLSPVCAAHAAGTEERYPLRPAPVPKRDVALTIILVEAPGGIVVRRRPDRGLLGGLWEFVTVEGHPGDEALAEDLRRQGYGNACIAAHLPAAKHVFTHLIWHMRGCVAHCDAVPADAALADAVFIEAHAFPGALRRYREIALEHLS